MPLLFESISHGEVPFGFFNIETDMILLDNYFFFASDVSNHISEMAELSYGNSHIQTWKGYVMELKKIGNLMGAISGIDLRGFIGEVYSYFPFPHEPDKFKQNPEGFKTRRLMESIIEKYAASSDIEVSIDENTWTISIGEYKFSKYGFQELIRYLWLGGYPRWKDDIKPDYIIRMKDKVESSHYPIFFGIKELLERT
ncbi:MAG: hypothetical protein N2596_08950 [Syntrophorhabdaceae bacterium]|nr:hypothetical protein [Syntrophorhabdaceae bacterium]